MKATKKRLDQIEKWKNRDMSWSQIASWQYDPEQWFRKYILDIDEGSNPAMEFGNVVGDTLGLPHSMVPKLNPSLVGVKEYKLNPQMGDVRLIGFCDHYCPETFVLNENKTSQNRIKWTQKSVHEHGQLTMYALMIYLQDGVKPEAVKMYLNYIPVKQGQDFQLYLPDPDVFYTYETKRTTSQALQFGAKIVRIRKIMEDYALAHD